MFCYVQSTVSKVIWVKEFKCNVCRTLLVSFNLEFLENDLESKSKMAAAQWARESPKLDKIIRWLIFFTKLTGCVHNEGRKKRLNFGVMMSKVKGHRGHKVH